MLCGLGDAPRLVKSPSILVLVPRGSRLISRTYYTATIISDASLWRSQFTVHQT